MNDENVNVRLPLNVRLLGNIFTEFALFIISTQNAYNKDSYVYKKTENRIVLNFM